VLAEFGYSDGEVATLIDERAVLAQA